MAVQSSSTRPAEAAGDESCSTMHPDVHCGQRLIRQQIDALNRIAQSLDPRFAHAVEALLALDTNARIVVSGMGKAGYVGMKLSSTLASIGFPSFFLHPADAIHGDLGRLQRNDVVLILSHSGETDEVVRLLPRIKRFGAQIIAITSSTSSSLGRHSDIVIETGKIPEAGPLGLAPTTSTTVMMALGDALAMTLLERKGISREEYAAFHPGGDLGRSLMLVSEIMRSGAKVCVVTEDTINSKALHNITATEGRPGCAAVVSATGEIVGVFTDGDLRRCLERESDFLRNKIGSVCSRNPVTIRSSQLAQEACRIIQERKVNQLFVVDDTNRPVGLVHIQDLLAHGMIRPETPL